MAVDKETVVQIARLARIRVPDEQQESLTGELNNILGWIEQLNEVETEGVAPMTSVVARKAPLRDDQVTDGDKPEEIVKNAPEADRGLLRGAEGDRIDGVT